METKTEQSFELLEVRNKSKLLQKYIHALQMNLQFIVTLVEGYIPVVIGSKSIMHECKQRIAILSKFAIYFNIITRNDLFEIVTSILTSMINI